MQSYITYRYRLYPNNAQRAAIDDHIAGTRILYNSILSDKIAQYERTGRNASFCPEDYFRAYPFLKQLDPAVLRRVQKDLDAAFKASDYKRAHYPFFRKTKPRGSYTAIAATLDGNRLYLPAVGGVKVKFHRPTPQSKLIKTTITRTASGEYYVSFLYIQTMKRAHSFLPITEDSTLGLDFSVPKFYVDSNGKSPSYPRFTEEAQGAIARASAVLRRRKKGSKRYEKQRRKLARLYQQVKNRRLDWLHKESRRLAGQYDTIVTETLDIHDIAQRFHLGIRTLDSAYATFQAFLAYKLESQGKHFYKLNPWTPTSQTCSHCGYRNRDLTLSDRFWKCPKCGKTISRDHNAAVNIKNRITALHR